MLQHLDHRVGHSASLDLRLCLAVHRPHLHVCACRACVRESSSQQWHTLLPYPNSARVAGILDNNHEHRALCHAQLLQVVVVDGPRVQVLGLCVQLGMRLGLDLCARGLLCVCFFLP